MMFMFMVIRNGGHSFTMASKDDTDFFALVVFLCLQCVHTLTHRKYKAWARHSVFYFDPLYMHWFSTKLSSFCFLFVFFSFFFPLPPILGLRSLAGGRREYGRSGRAPLYYIFLYIYIYVVNKSFSYILSDSLTFSTKIRYIIS